jgi:hypothetical protein
MTFQSSRVETRRRLQAHQGQLIFNSCTRPPYRGEHPVRDVDDPAPLLGPVLALPAENALGPVHEHGRAVAAQVAHLR